MWLTKILLVLSHTTSSLPCWFWHHIWNSQWLTDSDLHAISKTYLKNTANEVVPKVARLVIAGHSCPTVLKFMVSFNDGQDHFLNLLTLSFLPISAQQQHLNTLQISLLFVCAEFILPDYCFFFLGAAWDRYAGTAAEEAILSFRRPAGVLQRPADSGMENFC